MAKLSRLAHVTSERFSAALLIALLTLTAGCDGSDDSPTPVQPAVAPPEPITGVEE
jgi:hypothetical protein